MLRHYTYRTLINSRKLALGCRNTTFARRHLHSSNPLFKVKPYLLADIGEGIKECEVIQWFVQPGSKIEEFDPICEVQSDKASVEITSRYDGVVKAIHYAVGDMALVGKPLVDIDIQGEEVEDPKPVEQAQQSTATTTPDPVSDEPSVPLSKHASLATPAVRRLIKELGINIEDIQGTGKDGRVVKEDVLSFSANGKTPSSPVTQTPNPFTPKPSVPPSAEESIVPLTPVQTQMFKAMTNSLAIPHFLYTDEAEIDALTKLRSKVNALLAKNSSSTTNPQAVTKISYMPFFIKAMSIALSEYPIVNSRVTFDAATGKPQLVHRPFHNIGIAMNTPAGLIVPNIKNVEQKSILEIAQELARLQEAGANGGKFASSDLQNGTISLSNIGNVGGTYLAPVIVDSQVAIVGIGRARKIPGYNEKMEVVPKQVINTSWSGDHRVLDGMTLAQMAERFKQLLENPELMMMNIK